MDFINAIPGIFVIIGGLVLLGVGIIWAIFPFLVCARLDKIHRELQLIELSTKKAAPAAVSPYRSPVSSISQSERDAAWRAAQASD